MAPPRVPIVYSIVARSDPPTLIWVTTTAVSTTHSPCGVPCRHCLFRSQQHVHDCERLTTAMRPARSLAPASRDSLGRLDAPTPSTQGLLQSVKVDVDDRSREQRQKLRENQPADDRVTKRLTDLRSGSGTEHQRHAAKQCRHCGHQNGTEPQQTSLINRLLR